MSELLPEWLQYEHQCVLHLYETYGYEVYHWSVIPEDVLFKAGWLHNFNEERLKRLSGKSTFRVKNKHQEYGLDGIAVENGSVYHGLQCKMYSGTLGAEHLGTFYEVMLGCLRAPSIGYLLHTSKLRNNTRDNIANSDRLVSIRLPFNGQVVEEQVVDESTLTLRPYQVEAVSALSKGWKGVTSLIMPCGTGKTVVFGTHVKNHNYKRVIIASPLRIHAKQNLLRMKKFIPNHKRLLLDSDYSGTCDFGAVEKMWDDECLVSTTFDSLENVLYQLFYTRLVFEDEEDDELLRPRLDLSDTILIVDEGHNLTSNYDLQHLVRSFPRALIVTATYPGCLDEALDCDTIYSYSFREAINARFITDYRVWLPIITVNDDGVSSTDVIVPKELLSIDNHNDSVKKCLFHINGILRKGCRRSLTFATGISECDVLKSTYEKVFERYHGGADKVWLGIITANVSHTERTRILNEFSNGVNHEIYILISVRILDEGVDIPMCDSVFITSVTDSSSTIRVVQRMCRANRLCKSNPSKIAHLFMWCDDTAKAIGVLSLLKAGDVEFAKKVAMINSTYESGDKEETTRQEEKVNMEFADYIRVKCMSPSEMWEMKKEALFKWCDEHKRTPSMTCKTDPRQKQLGMWLNTQKTRKIKSVDDDVYVALSANSYVKKSIDELLESRTKTNEEIFNEKKEALFKWCDEHKRTPSTTCKTDPRQKQLRKWLDNQKKRKITSVDDDVYIALSANPYVKESIDDCLESRTKTNEEIFNEKKEALFKWCDEHKRTPSTTCKTDPHHKQLGRWLDRQKKKIRSVDDNVYIALSANPYVKKSIDKLLAGRLRKTG